MVAITTVAFWINAWVQPPSDQRILYWQESRPIFTPSANFAQAFAEKGIDDPLNQMHETVVTVWRAEGRPIDAASIRRPLSFSAKSGSTILDVVPIATGTTFDGMPTLDLEGDLVSVTWSVFDPGMALKFAVLTSGVEAGLRVSSDVGPNILVQENYPTTPQYLILFAVLILGVLGITWAGVAYAQYSYSRAVRLKGGPLNDDERERYLPVIPSMAISALGVGVTLLVLWLLFGLFTPAVPLPLSSVTGL